MIVPYQRCICESRSASASGRCPPCCNKSDKGRTGRDTGARCCPCCSGGSFAPWRYPARLWHSPPANDSTTAGAFPFGRAEPGRDTIRMSRLFSPGVADESWRMSCPARGALLLARFCIIFSFFSKIKKREIFLNVV